MTLYDIINDINFVLFWSEKFASVQGNLLCPILHAYISHCSQHEFEMDMTIICNIYFLQNWWQRSWIKIMSWENVTWYWIRSIFQAYWTFLKPQTSTWLLTCTSFVWSDVIDWAEFYTQWVLIIFHRTHPIRIECITSWFCRYYFWCHASSTCCCCRSSESCLDCCCYVVSCCCDGCCCFWNCFSHRKTIILIFELPLAFISIKIRIKCPQ